MLHRSLLRAITSCFSRRNRHNINVYCSTSNYNSLDESLKKTKYINTLQEEKKIKNVNSDDEKQKKEGKRREIVQSINPDIVNCSEQPTEVPKKKVINRVLYLTDEKDAETYISLIIKDLLKNTCFVAEMNPGSGILTKRLLETGVPSIHVYETRKEFYPMLNKLRDTYPGRLSVTNCNLINMGQMLYKDRKTDGRQVETLFEDVKDTKWEDETCMQIVGATDSPPFFRHLINSLIFQNCFMSKGRPVFYIMIPPSFWHRYTCDTSNARLYTSLKVMFQIMFHYELLGTLDRKAFRPSPIRKKFKRASKLNEIMEQDYNEMYVIKLEPRSDLYSQLTKKDWIIFWYFVRHHMQKRSSRLITDLEKWVPGCGNRLAENYTIFTQIGDLTPAQILEVFKEFKSWPEYKESYFLTSMSDVLNTYNEPALLDHKLLRLDE